VGELWGTLEWQDSWPLRNISPGGAMVESRRPLPLESLHAFSLSPSARMNAIHARVRHLTCLEPDHPQDGYLIGFEFVEFEYDAEADVAALLRAIALAPRQS
jgi:hypothetical protein